MKGVPIDQAELKERQELKAWVAEELEKLKNEDGVVVYTIPVHEDILRTWRITRPKMVKELDEDGLTEDLAKVLQKKAGLESQRLMKGGMAPTWRGSKRRGNG